MPATHFPNGISTVSGGTTSAGGALFNTLIVNSAATLSGAGTFGGLVTANAGLTVVGAITGETQLLTYTFSTASTAQTASLPVPWAGNVTAFYVVTGSVASVVANYTVQVGSAGSVAVATVANTTSVVGGQEGLTTTTTAFTTASGLRITRGTQGTAGDTTIGVLVQRT